MCMLCCLMNCVSSCFFVFMLSMFNCRMFMLCVRCLFVAAAWGWGGGVGGGGWAGDVSGGLGDGGGGGGDGERGGGGEVGDGGGEDDGGCWGLVVEVHEEQVQVFV